MGMYWFRRGEIEKKATGQAMTLNQANFVNAKTSTFEYFQVPVSISANDELAMAA